MTTRSTIAGIASAVVAGALVIATPAHASSGAPQPAARRSARVQPAVPETVELSVMSQNIFYGGDDYDLTTGDFCPVSDGCPQALTRLAAVIKQAGADVVGVQEAERNTRRLANLLGWYASPRAHVISRFPIVDPPHSGGVYVFVEPTPGRVLAVANVHLPSTPYGPYEVRDGATKTHVLRVERTLRMPAIVGPVGVLKRLMARGIPVVLTGDFNSPSHLDWTPAVSAVRSQVPYPVVWPVSKALADAGLIDSYRDVHPDPVATPGFTWTPGGPETDPHEVFDRIDWVLHSGGITTAASRLVGETGGADVDVAVTPPYPSDHRGVVSTLDVNLAPSPVLVSVSTRRVTSHRPITVTFHAPGHSGEQVRLVRHRLSGGRHVVAAKSTAPAGAVDGQLVFSRHLKPGRYDAELRSAGGRTLSSTAFWVYRPGSHATVSTSRRSYAVGQPIKIHWTRAPGMALDWIGVFRCHPTKCAGNGGYLLYTYTRTTIVGHGRIGPSAATLEGAKKWPLRPGTYVARLLIDDSYISIGHSRRFTIH
jgi:endonuclease/exonuclease/phosphatase family metal-dependent hydrolase